MAWPIQLVNTSEQQAKSSLPVTKHLITKQVH